MDILIDPADKDAVIAASEDEIEAWQEACLEVEDLLIEVVPLLKAVSRGETYPADKAKRLLNDVMDRVGCLVVPGLLLDHPPGGSRPHLRLIRS